MGSFIFDHNDAWSRFHHLRNVLNLTRDAFGPTAIDLDEIREMVSDSMISQEEQSEHVESLQNSRLLEQEVAARFLTQSVAAAVYASFEFSLINLVRLFQICAHGSSSLDPRDQRCFRKAVAALEEQGVATDSDDFQHLKVLRDVRHAMMHRGGLLNRNDARDAKIIEILTRSPSIWLLPCRDDDAEMLSIDMRFEYVHGAISSAKSIIDDASKRLSAAIADASDGGSVVAHA